MNVVTFTGTSRDDVVDRAEAVGERWGITSWRTESTWEQPSHGERLAAPFGTAEIIVRRENDDSVTATLTVP